MMGPDFSWVVVTTGPCGYPAIRQGHRRPKCLRDILSRSPRRNESLELLSKSSINWFIKSPKTPVQCDTPYLLLFVRTGPPSKFCTGKPAPRCQLRQRGEMVAPVSTPIAATVRSPAASAMLWNLFLSRRQPLLPYLSK